MSLWTMPRECIYWKTLAESSAMRSLVLRSISTFDFFMCKMLNRLPWLTCSNTITMLGIFGTIPINKAIFGCLRIACITISFWISASRSSVIEGSKIFFIATGHPFKKPLWITLKPPWPICSPNSMSSIVTSLTPGTAGSLPSFTETLDEPCVN